MIGYLLAIGYTPIEIMVYLCTERLLERLKEFNLVAMVNGGGATSFSHIHEHLEKMTINKIGQLITLKELYNTYNKMLICITHNLTTNKTEELSYKTHPNMPCLIALRMSSNLPLIFEHFKYLDSFYVDGGVSNNFPINIGEKEGEKILGITLCDKNIMFNPGDNMLEYVYKLLSIQSHQIVLDKIKNKKDKTDIIKLQPDTHSFFNFNIDTHTKLEMFSNGYIQMKEQFFS